MQNKTTLCVYSLSHLVVDFACFFVLMGAFSSEIGNVQLISLGFLFYNAVAFVLQAPLGYVVDVISSSKTSKTRVSPAHFAALGCLLVILGVMCPVLPWLRVAFCSLGNAFFHIGGGIDSLVFANGRYGRSGVFISFGALGVALGTLVGREEQLSPWIVVLLLVICLVFILRFCLQTKSPYQTTFNNSSARIKTSWIVILLCAFIIIIRAAVGADKPDYIEYLSDFFIMLSALTVFAGKFVGGLLADRFGARIVAASSLLLSAPLLAFANSQIEVYCIGLFFFNISTSITLCVIVSHLPNNPGLSFGLTTMALFLGNTLISFWALPYYSRPALVLAFVFIAALCIYLVAAAKTTKTTTVATSATKTNERKP